MVKLLYEKLEFDKYFEWKRGLYSLERHQGNWKIEGEEKYNIGELVIDNDYIEFFVRGKSIPFPCTFIGSNGEHPIKVYTKGVGRTKHKSLNMSFGYKVAKIAMTNGQFQEGFEIKNISAFSFEIPELVEWLKINSVSIGYNDLSESWVIIASNVGNELWKVNIIEIKEKWVREKDITVAMPENSV